MILRMALVAAILTCIVIRSRLAGAGWITFSALSIIASAMALIGFGTVRAQHLPFFVALEFYAVSALISIL